MKPFITTSYRYLKNYLWHVSTLTFLVITPYLLEGWPFAFTLRAWQALMMQDNEDVLGSYASRHTVQIQEYIIWATTLF